MKASPTESPAPFPPHPGQKPSMFKKTIPEPQAPKEMKGNRGNIDSLVAEMDEVEGEINALNAKISALKLESGFTQMKEKQAELREKIHEALIANDMKTIKSQTRKKTFTLANTAPLEERKEKAFQKKKEKIFDALQGVEDLAEDMIEEIVDALVPAPAEE